MTNNKQKGKRVERYVVNWLKERGIHEAKRSVQYCGAAGDADVITGKQMKESYIEVKGTVTRNVQASKLKKWIEQVLHDCPSGKKPVIFHKANRLPLTAIYQTEDPEVWEFEDANEWFYRNLVR